MTVLDIGGGFNGTETQLELVGLGVWFLILTFRMIRIMIRTVKGAMSKYFDNQNAALIVSYFCPV